MGREVGLGPSGARDAVGVAAAHTPSGYALALTLWHGSRDALEIDDTLSLTMLILLCRLTAVVFVLWPPSFWDIAYSVPLWTRHCSTLRSLGRPLGDGLSLLVEDGSK
ncbi:unnamed protein product [Heligmosomoides polygyrus]|uniref:Uncharacterized protein n=1 Tax=Heligmosomoides polygyrus TaxID=6339 RepID=A0A183FXL0_HELPZ|nr:unnamed protein product [Heligmosomoides polygyrus]